MSLFIPSCLLFGVLGAVVLIIPYNQGEDLDVSLELCLISYARYSAQLLLIHKYLWTEQMYDQTNIIKVRKN